MRIEPAPATAHRAKNSPALHHTQVERLALLRAAPDVRSVAVHDVALVTDSVQVTVLINRSGHATEAVIAPSGRLHVL
jgi:hypothetical protein